MFHRLKIREIRRETPDTVSISFEVPEELVSHFRFKQGQHLTLKTDMNGEEVRRSYSICTGVGENDLRVAVKKVQGGVFSAWANELLQSGDFLDVMVPQGHFYTELSPVNQKNYVAFAAGSGITPILSLLATALEIETESRFTLIYGNRSAETTMFRAELDALIDEAEQNRGES